MVVQRKPPFPDKGSTSWRCRHTLDLERDHNVIVRFLLLGPLGLLLLLLDVLNFEHLKRLLSLHAFENCTASLEKAAERNKDRL